MISTFSSVLPVRYNTLADVVGVASECEKLTTFPFTIAEPRNNPPRGLNVINVFGATRSN
ncbi:hypothetical protein D3C75_1287450 [compost metagenome]